MSLEAVVLSYMVRPRSRRAGLAVSELESGFESDCGRGCELTRAVSQVDCVAQSGRQQTRHARSVGSNPGHVI